MPAPVVNGGGDRCWKWKEFKLWRARDLDLDLRSGHTAYRRASLIDLYLYTNFMEMGRKKFRKSTLTLTFDPAIRHVVLHQSSTSRYIPNFIQIEETFCGRTDVRTYGWTDIFPLYIIRSTLGSRPNNHVAYVSALDVILCVKPLPVRAIVDYLGSATCAT